MVVFELYAESLDAAEHPAMLKQWWAPSLGWDTATVANLASAPGKDRRDLAGGDTWAMTERDLEVEVGAQRERESRRKAARLATSAIPLFHVQGQDRDRCLSALYPVDRDQSLLLQGLESTPGRIPTEPELFQPGEVDRHDPAAA